MTRISQLAYGYNVFIQGVINKNSSDVSAKKEVFRFGRHPPSSNVLVKG